MNRVFRHLHMPWELACEFWGVFSRMEYALKATPAYARNASGRVEAWWDRFANDIDAAFNAIPDNEFRTAVNYLNTKPPRKQAFRNGAVAFVDQKITAKQTKAQQTLLMIRTVRNNLLHGGKHYPHGEQEAGRNHLLVSHSLVVLKYMAALNADVRQRYEY